MDISSNPSPQTSPSPHGATIDRARIVAILRAYGVLHASLFGSVARGEQRADSDVDLLIDLPPGASLMDVSRLGLELEDTLGRPVDLVTSFDVLHPVIQERLRREEEVLL
jgi:predicted nucleotidyltransferase